MAEPLAGSPYRLFFGAQVISFAAGRGRLQRHLRLRLCDAVMLGVDFVVYTLPAADWCGRPTELADSPLWSSLR
jgi:hypothetical protein